MTTTTTTTTTTTRRQHFSLRWRVQLLLGGWFLVLANALLMLSSPFKSKMSQIRLSLSNDATANTTPSSSSSGSSPQCPFSKAFPRYRIDLSRPKKKKDSGKKQWSPLSFFNKSNSRSRIEQYKKPHEDLIWASDLTNGISATAMLWQQACDVMEASSENSKVVALPNLENSLIVQNWVEIVDWMNAELSQYMPGRVHATMINDESSVAAVRVQRVGSAIPSGVPTAVSEETINKRTRSWVKRILVEQNICPFTKSDRRSGHGLSDVGVPTGNIAYHASLGGGKNNLYRIQADLWKAIVDMIAAGPGGKTGTSSILLAVPAMDDDFDLFGGPLFTTFEAGVIAAQAESQIGVVCFHPLYQIPDGSTFPGFGQMHSVVRLEKWYQEELERRKKKSKRTTNNEVKDDDNSSLLSKEDLAAGGAWQRRTPHATINVLRADQLEVAESKRNSASMYSENIEKLVGPNGIGLEKLARDLEYERSIEA
jgi:hypothetical protein